MLRSSTSHQRLSARSTRSFTPRIDHLETRQLMAADLAMSIDNHVNELYPGDIIRYVIAVVNQGEAEAQDVRIVTELDAAIDEVSWSRFGETNRHAGNVDEVRDLGPGDRAIYVVWGVAGADILGEVHTTVNLHMSQSTSEGDGVVSITAADIDAAPLRIRSANDISLVSSHDICLDQTHVIGDTLYFVGVGRGACFTPRVTLGSSGYFREDLTTPPWTGDLIKTDGTSSGTRVVKQIRTVGEPAPLDAFYHPEFVDLNGILYFPANDGIHGRELWRSDGTDPGTYLVKDIDPEPANPCLKISNSPECETFLFRDVGSEISFMMATEDWIYFTANDGVHGRELWRTDGSTEGTTMVLDIAAGSESAFGTERLWLDPYFTPLGNKLIFVANDGVHGRELWQTDGTADGTRLVTDLAVIGGSNPRNLHLVGDHILFEADDGSGENRWITDGTAAGTHPSDIEAPELVPQTNVYFRDDAFYFTYDIADHERLIAHWTPPELDAEAPYMIETVGDKLLFWNERYGTGANMYAMKLPTGFVDAGGPYLPSFSDGFVKSYATEFLAWQPARRGAFQLPHTNRGGLDLPTSPGVVLGNTDDPLLLENGAAMTLGFPSNLADGPGPDLDIRLDREAAVYVMDDRGEFWHAGDVSENNHLLDLEQFGDQRLSNVVRIEGTTLLWRTAIYSVSATLTSSVVLTATAPDNDDLVFDWDLDGDGTFDDRSGRTVSLTQADLARFGIHEPGEHTIAVRMLDRIGSFVDTAVLTVPNVSPTADLDGDGLVAFSDFLMLSASFGKEDATRNDGDLDGDGMVAFADFLILKSQLA